MKDIINALWLIVFTSVIVSVCIGIVAFPIAWLTLGRPFDYDDCTLWFVAVVLVTALLLLTRKNKKGELLPFTKLVVILLISATAICSCQKHSVKAETVKKVTNEQLITAYQDYYFAVETLLDSIQQDIDLEDTYMETDAGAQYLEFKYDLDSLCYEACH